MEAENEDVDSRIILTSIYDDDMIEKILDTDGKRKWKCKWCNGEFSSWNAMKCIQHVNKISKMDINETAEKRACRIYFNRI